MRQEIKRVPGVRAEVDPSAQATVVEAQHKTFEWPVAIANAKSAAASLGKIGQLTKNRVGRNRGAHGRSSFAMRARCHQTIASPGKAVKKVSTKNGAQPKVSERMPAGAPSKLRGNTAMADSAAY